MIAPRSNGKPDAATEVDKLLMMGMRMPETCWAVFKRQAINLKDWCTWLVDLLEQWIKGTHVITRKIWNILFGILARIWADFLGEMWSMSPDKSVFFSSKCPERLWVYQASCSMSSRRLSPRINCQGPENNHSPSSTTRFKSERFIFLLPYIHFWSA